MPESWPDSRGILISAAESAVFVEGGLTLGSEISLLGMRRIVWHRGSNRRLSVQSHWLDPRHSPEYILGFFLSNPSRWGRCLVAYLVSRGSESPPNPSEKATLTKRHFELGGGRKEEKCEILAQVKNQLAVFQDYQTPINHPWLISFLTADKSSMGPGSHWLLAVTTVRFELNEVDPSFYSLVGLGRDIFLLQVHLKDPPAISPRRYPIQQTPSSLWALSVPSALKPKANCTVSIQILKSFKVFDRFFFPLILGHVLKPKKNLLLCLDMKSATRRDAKVISPFPDFKVHNAINPSPSQSHLFFSHSKVYLILRVQWSYLLFKLIWPAFTKSNILFKHSRVPEIWYYQLNVL